jgi:hypothetical protein
MNILELDSYKLSDAVKFNQQLNPKLWGSDEHLKPQVREHLLKIAEDFREFLGIDDLQLKDITISGSNAAYNYTDHSDVDLHLVVDIPQADKNDVYRELFDAKKYQYNDMHDFKIGGYDVELYVQNANQPHHSQGIYSVVNNDWTDVPKRQKAIVDDASVRDKYEDMSRRIDQAVKSGDLAQLTRLAEKIKDFRQAGLDQTGEYGPENLAFKMLRSQGKIKALYDARNSAKDKELSLKERKRPGSVFKYGFKHEEMQEDATETPDGVSATTCMFLDDENSLPSDEEILKDFIEFCVKELKLQQIPRIKLRRDPQWSVVNKTFGRYIDDVKMLEVAWGQRHIMDVLRTVAHELTHTHQHERDGSRMGPDAGETGSPWENEANARAGVLMRDYARLHPDYFEKGQASDLHVDEGYGAYTPAGKKIIAQQNKPVEGRQFVYQGHRIVFKPDALEIYHGPELKYRKAGKYDHVTKIQVSTARHLVDMLVRGYTKGTIDEGASGYIPTPKQAKDPRYIMALTKDVRPGAVGKEANKLKLKTNSQGQPQLANPNGLFEQLRLQLEAFKEGVALDEVKMSPSALKQFASSPAAKGILVGFEAEMIVPDVNTGDDSGEMEPDYDADERCRSIQQVMEFFEYDEFGYGLSGREADKLQEKLDEVYYEWYDDQMYRDFKEEAEDLIKKVMIDEKDWVQEDEVRKQLDMMEITGADQEAVLAAGSQAPRFNSTTEQQAYMAEHPEYDKYVEALEQAEGLLDDLVQDSVSSQDKNWDAALEDFRDNYYVDDDSGFFDDVGLRYMSDVANRFDIYWPYMTFDEGEGSQDIDSVADDLSEAIGMPVVASYSYHGATRKPGQFIIEPDSSLSPDNREDGGLEIISPPMPIAQAMEKLNQVIEWAQAKGCYTNSSTGLHMGVSLPGQNSFAEDEGDVDPAPVAEKPIDFMKLALFLGDQHVLKEFGRQANNYCASSLKKMKERRWSPQQIATAMEKMRGNLINLAYKDLADRSPGRDSINMKDNYVEFRGAGGDYLSRESDEGMDFLENTLLRYVQALAIAGDPNAYRNEYAKKLYKLISPEGDNTLDLFSKFATGEITQEQLKKDWAKRTLEKDDPSAVAKGNWVVVDNNTGKTVQGQEYSGYTEQEVYDRAKAKLGEYMTKVAFDMAYSIHPKETGKWEIYRDDHGKDETLEIIDADRRGEAVDKAYDKYSGVIPFKVRAYYGDEEAKPDPTPRAKLAKRIIQKPTQQPAPSTNPNPTAPIANQVHMPNGVPVWLLFDVDTGSVLKEIPDHTAREAYDQGMTWLGSIGAENPETYGERFAIKPKMQTGSADWRGDLERHVQDATMDVAQNFAAPLDATEQTGTWQLIDVTLNQPVETFQGTWAQAERIAQQYETGPGEHNGHEISIRRA